MVSRHKLNSIKNLEYLDRKYIWHPFTQMKEYIEKKPVIILRGEGIYLIDIYGKRYIDGVSSIWTNVHGHRKKEIDEAILKQLTKISHSTLLGLTHPPAIELAKKLINITPNGLCKVFYSDNGSTAVEIGLKMVFQYLQQKSNITKKKTKFISFFNAYHGDTVGSVSIGGIELFHDIFKPLLFNPYRVRSPYCYRCHINLNFPECGYACLEELETLLRKNADSIAALIIEPIVQGAAGMLVSPLGYLKRLRELCSQFQIFFIADEVATGFGRTGKMFACEYEGVSPDIMALAKGITGGYLPLAATLTTEEIFNGFLGEYKELKTFFHGHTYTGNPLACASAIASLNIFKKEGTLKKMETKITHFEKELYKLYELNHVGDIRHKGFMVGIELVSDRDKKKPYPIQDKIGTKVIMEARKYGLILRPLGNVIVLMPPLIASKRILSRIVDITYTSIKNVTEKTKK